MRTIIPFSNYNPDLGVRQTDQQGNIISGGIPSMANLVPQNNTFRPCAKPVLYTDTSVDEDIILVKGFYSSQTTNKTFMFTESAIYRIDSDTPTEIEHSVQGSKSFETGGNDNWDVDIYGTTLFLTNNDDQLQIISSFASSSTCSSVSEAPAKCKSIQMFENCLFTLNTYESSTNYYLRLRRSAYGDPEDFTADPDTGAGYIDLPSYGDFGVAVRRLGDVLVAYCKNSIYFVRYVGPPFWFQYEKVAENIGALSTHSVAVIDRDMHIFIASHKDGIYITTQNGVQKIGSYIEETHIHSLFENPSRITNAVNHGESLLYFTLTSSVKEPDKLLCYNYKENRFSVILDDYDDTFLGSGQTITSVGNALTPDIVIDNMGSYYSTINSIPDSLKIDSYFWNGGEEAVAIGLSDSTDRDVYFFDSIDFMGAQVSTSEIQFDNLVTVTDIIPRFDGVTSPFNFTLTVYYKYNEADYFKTKTITKNKYNQFKFLITARFFRFVLEMSLAFKAIEGIEMFYKTKGYL